ncbi:hypothetical protein BDS110ZK4_30250 [Bradyrhizobium diazoefficiens]|uniref:Uncharacterized protein n=1 Tax=Bradyrhizobium diazoefficiens TaxID=1355477 RepID=A0A810CV56_9BRAD|nr:hypothetical protein XF4B_45020 [Bradyrhizobium diazoefficiens]BCE91669.1 hypothetical protein XF10B_44670 [Bradyrhizobium diazoefficiens]
MTKIPKKPSVVHLLPERPGTRRAGPPQAVWPDEAFDLELGDGGSPPTHPDAFDCLAGAAFEAAVLAPLRRKLAHGQALAVTILVPTWAWSGPVAWHFGEVFGDRWRSVAPTSAAAAARADITVASHLASGQCVVGVSADEALFPPALVAAADIAIAIPPPSAPVLRAAIARFTGRPAPKDLVCEAGGLDLPALATCFRPGSGAARIAGRLVGAREALRAHGIRTRKETPEDERAPAIAHADGESGPC